MTKQHSAQDPLADRTYALDFYLLIAGARGRKAYVWSRKRSLANVFFLLACFTPQHCVKVGNMWARCTRIVAWIVAHKIVDLVQTLPRFYLKFLRK